MSAYVCLYFLIVCYIIMSKKIQVLRSKIQTFLSRCLPLLFPVSSSFQLSYFSHSSSIFLLTHYFLFWIIYFSTSLSVVIFLLFLFIFTEISTWLSNSIHQWLISSYATLLLLYLRSSWRPSSLIESLSCEISSSSPDENRIFELYYNL